MYLTLSDESEVREWLNEPDLPNLVTLKVPVEMLPKLWENLNVPRCISQKAATTRYARNQCLEYEASAKSFFIFFPIKMASA
jgi:hypothetical protein